MIGNSSFLHDATCNFDSDIINYKIKDYEKNIIIDRSTAYCHFNGF
jgi:hypothetical protein